MTVAVDNEREQLQSRTVASLRLAQVPGQAAYAGLVAVVSLLVGDMLGSDRLAGIGGAALTTGTAIATIPLAAFMRRRGRRPGLVRALLIAAVGAAIAAVGGQLTIFPLFVVGLLAVGAGQAATLQQRYVAADLARPDRAARAISAIVWVGTLGAVFGPVLTPVAKAGGRAVGLDDLVGPFVLSAVLFAVAASTVAVRLRPDPLEVLGAVEPDAERVRPLRQVKASIGAIGESAAARLGLLAMVVSQAAMVAVMVMTPPHMDDHGHEDLSAFVVAFHIVGMYALAPVVGRLSDRFGAVRAIPVGAAILVAGVISTVMAGYVPALMFAGLFLLGLGWNVGIISGSAILTRSVAPAQRVEVQGTADLAMSVSGAVAAFGSGFVKDSFGFHVLADAAALLGALLIVAAWVTRARARGLAA